MKVAYGHTRITHITGVGGSSHQGLQRVAAFSLIHRSKSETQGLLSRLGGVIRARLGLLHLGLAGHLSCCTLGFTRGKGDIALNNSRLQLSLWILPTFKFKFKLFNFSHLLEVAVIWRRKIAGTDPDNFHIFSFTKIHYFGRERNRF